MIVMTHDAVIFSSPTMPNVSMRQDMTSVDPGPNSSTSLFWFAGK